MQVNGLTAAGQETAVHLGALCRGFLDVPPEFEALSVKGIAYDSRDVRPGDVFVAVSGLTHDGSRFAAQAVERGAVAVVAQNAMPLAVPLLVADHCRKALAQLANRFYGDVSRRLIMAGITGTNGKTTTAFFMESIFRQAGLEPGLMGTVLARWTGKEHPAFRTTPESADIHKTLRSMADDGVKAVAMEVSSHALALDRVFGMTFKAAVFTNLTQDHLDFHASMEAYGKAKALLFGMVAPDGIAVVNADDQHAEMMTIASSAKTVTFGLNNQSSDYVVRNLNLAGDGTRFTLSRGQVSIAVTTRLRGRFNAMNAAAAAVCGLELGLKSDAVLRGIENCERVPGRMDGVAGPFGFGVVVDYAHTPDALENVLVAVREFTKEKVIAVFGCGGDRDRTKRAVMGAVAAKLADRVIVTSDNPRSENPQTIIDEIIKGMGRFRQVEILPDRETAIHRALDGARPGDTVVVAGKGHETYQEIGGKRLPFDDRQVIETHLRRMAGR
jgi:UDP-N-acetylmuramoyl-L-alanyl-D-glutamate--2,6-diaminopimelate ligase